jgi:four helix bundle protein
MVTDLKARTKKFALEIVRLDAALPKRTEAQVLGRQLLRSGTSVGRSLHEAQRAKSNGPIDKVKTLQQESNELTGIFVPIARKAKSRTNRPKP